MKSFSIIFIMTVSFFVGYLYKNRINNELNFLIYMKNFAEYLKSNINLFKNNIVQIIDEFLLINHTKNAKFNQIFEKNTEIYQFSKKNIEKMISNNQISFLVFNFLNTLGTNDYEFEGEKINDFINTLNTYIVSFTQMKKEKGELFFKLSLSVGAIISILVW